jgi:hypothetical protein
MLVFGCLMVFAALKSKAGASWGKAATGGSAAVVLLLVLVSIIHSIVAKPEVKADGDRVNSQVHYGLLGFGKAIGRKFKGSKAMLVTYISTDEKQLATAKASLTEGLAGDVEIVHVWTPSGPADLSEAPYDAAKLDAAFNGSGADLIITLAGMPSDFQDLDLLRLDKAPKLAVLNHKADTNLMQLIMNNYVQLAVIGNAGYKQPPKLPDAETYFSSRFVLVTPENVGENKDRFR